jgi:hypothetical protein
VVAVLALLAVLIARASAEPQPVLDIDGELANRPDVTDWFDDGPSVEPPLPHAKQVARIAASAPPVSAVVGAVYRAASVDKDPGPGWRRRSRIAALVPSVSVHDGRDATWRDDIAQPVITNISLLSVTATWHLDRLVYDPTEMHVAAYEASRRRERRRLAKITIRSYFRWLRARADAELDERWMSRADEAAAELDALSDGWFSRALAALAARNADPTREKLDSRGGDRQAGAK